MTKVFIDVSQGSATHVASQIRQAKQLLAGIIGKVVEAEEGSQFQSGIIQRANDSALIQYKTAMAAAGTPVAEGVTVTLPRFTLVADRGAALYALLELAEADYTARPVKVPVIVEDGEVEPE